MMKLIKTLSAGWGVGLLLAGWAFAGDSGDVVWDRYVEAKQELQTGLHDLIVKTRPDLAGIAETYRDMQLALIALRSAKFKYLMATEPARIVRDQGVVAYSNFDWSVQDAERFFKKESHREMQMQVNQLKEKNNSDPRWPEMRTHFVTLTESPEYREIMQDFLDAQNEVAADLKSSQ